MSKPQLYFLDKQMDGEIVRLLSSWDPPRELVAVEFMYWFRTRFVSCRDSLRSEDSDTLRWFFFKLLTVFHARETELREEFEAWFDIYVTEITTIIAATRTSPVSLWIYGDDLARQLLQTTLAGLPSVTQQHAFFRRSHIHNRYMYDLLMPEFEADQAEREYRKVAPPLHGGDFK